MKRCLYTECLLNGRGKQCRCWITGKSCIKFPADARRENPAFRRDPVKGLTLKLYPIKGR